VSPSAEKTQGRWKSILPAMGVDDKHLTGRHGPCPVCGGKDRFRFDDKDGRGTFICTNCGAGDGFKLVELVTGREFKDTIRDVERAAGVAEQETKSATANADEVLKDMRAMWKAALPPEGTTWWRDRSVRTPDSPDIRYHDGIDAVLSLVRDTDGRVVNMHRTYLDPKRRLLMPLPLPAGSAVRTCNFDDGEIGIAEGIETALSARDLFKVPTWSCMTADNLSKWIPPKHATSIVIYADNDASFTGMWAAGTLAKRLAAQKKTVRVMFPENVGDDWNDVLMREPF